MTIEQQQLDSYIRAFESMKRLGDRTLHRLSWSDLKASPHPKSNSIAVLVKHLHGNMRSRWTDFLHTDGEKSDRDRDGEFVDDLPDRETALARWEEGWNHLFSGMRALKGEDLMRTVILRSEPVTVIEAIMRQITHCSYHVGQIVYIGAYLKGDDWDSLSIPRGQSAKYIEDARQRFENK